MVHQLQVNHFTIVFIRMILFFLLATSTQYGPSSSILDVYLTLEARRLKKAVIGLETVEMYCEVCFSFFINRLQLITRSIVYKIPTRHSRIKYHI